MRNFSDPTWDAQFQTDERDGKVNVGWFWARPTPQSIDYFVEAKHIWFTKGGVSDQNLMQRVMAEKERQSSSNSNQRSLVFVRLDLKTFLNYMGTEWIQIFSARIRSETNFFTLNESLRFQLIHNASNDVVLWHYTCVDKSLKLFLPKYFGQWTNVNDYYTKPRKFLLPINIGFDTNSTNVLLIQFLITIKLAIITERTLIFPDTVVYKTIRNFPAVRTFSLKEIIPLNIDYVEPNYLYHRQAKHGINFTNGFNYIFSTDRNLPLNQQLENLLRDLQSSLKSNELIKLDFSTFQSINDLLGIKNFDEWWKNNLSVNDKRYVNLNQLRLCHNIDQQEIGCTRICL